MQSQKAETFVAPARVRFDKHQRDKRAQSEEEAEREQREPKKTTT